MTLLFFSVNSTDWCLLRSNEVKLSVLKLWRPYVIFKSHLVPETTTCKHIAYWIMPPPRVLSDLRFSFNLFHHLIFPQLNTGSVIKRRSYLLPQIPMLWSTLNHLVSQCFGNKYCQLLNQNFSSIFKQLVRIVFCPMLLLILNFCNHVPAFLNLLMPMIYYYFPCAIIPFSQMFL